MLRQGELVGRSFTHPVIIGKLRVEELLVRIVVHRSEKRSLVVTRDSRYRRTRSRQKDWLEVIRPLQGLIKLEGIALRPARSDCRVVVAHEKHLAPARFPSGPGGLPVLRHCASPVGISAFGPRDRCGRRARPSRPAWSWA
jgi:hypothetical protein